MSLVPTSPSSPVIKVGAVILRSGLPAQFLIIQPKPKNSGEVPQFVLPRGSRQYQDATGNWHDVRDVVTGEKHAAQLEPFTRALEREVEEEAGISPEQLARAKVLELGRMEFQSRSKGVYPIHWFVVQPDAATAEGLTRQTPPDTLALRWATLAEAEKMATEGTFSAGYLPVMNAALSQMIAATPSTSGQNRPGAEPLSR